VLDLEAGVAEIFAEAGQTGVEHLKSTDGWTWVQRAVPCVRCGLIEPHHTRLGCRQPVLGPFPYLQLMPDGRADPTDQIRRYHAKKAR
jgi:hypothetical protein